MNADKRNEFQNSLDRDSINQLHAALLQVSQTCYDIKKLCATIIGSVVAGVVGLAQVQPDVRVEYSFFLIGAAISSFFWFLDGQNYLLQRKIRLRMKELANNIAERSGFVNLVDGIGMPIARRSKQDNLLLQSAFNHSMVFYYLLTSIFITLALLQIFGVLPTIVLKKTS
ncbi:hypothetical protein [Nodosilinea nodulosa]|uniref:hypothetical protein n=1 Tax=Nodosilinea nodulosa TaxID=416001 RepID=UPI0003792690|nr:hypothetical protein [Nodosilinea nodulosa]